MSFVSIRSKLISQVSRILISSFILLIIAVAALQFWGSRQNLAQAELHIRTSLEAKAKLLVANNSLALQGMAEDYAFTAVRELVSSTVSSDPDIVYGLFIDADGKPWVNADHQNPSGQVQSPLPLSDEVSQWALALENVGYIEREVDGLGLVEFAAPVILDDEPLGVIRYGVSTARMQQELMTAEHHAVSAGVRTASILIFLAVCAIGLGVTFTRRMAQAITRPLSTLTSSAEVIAQGNYSQDVGVKGNDEIGLLADNFDAMRRTIKKKIDDLAELNSMGEMLAKTHDRDKAIYLVLKSIKAHFDAAGSWALLYTDNRVVISHQVCDNLVELGLTNLLRREVAQLGETNNHGKLVRIDDDATSSLLTYLLIPVDSATPDARVLMIQLDNATCEVERSDMEFCSAMARALSISLENIDMQEVIEEQNRTLEEKVALRTEELQEKTNDILCMMQNMHQGLFTILDDGRIHHEYAAFCEQLFETDQIANQIALDLLFKQSTLGTNTLDQVKTALSAIIGEDEMMWMCNSHLLVTEYVMQFGDGREKIIELDWDPIVFEDTVEKVMITARDVTELKALQREADAQRKELDIIGQILAISAEDFSTFIQSADDYVAKCRELIEQTTQKDLQVVSELFRNMHTVKGNARTYGFNYITDSVHDAESTYDDLRKTEAAVWQQHVLLDELQQVEEDLAVYAQLAEQKLGRSTKAGNDKVDMNADDIRLALGHLGQLNEFVTCEDAVELLGEVRRTLEKTQGRSLPDALAPVQRSVESLAGELSKPVPKVNYLGDDSIIVNDKISILQDVFTHLMRNSLDHGIELPDERVAKNKTDFGNITITASKRQDNFVIEIQDDGKGLPLHKLKEKGIEAGLFDANEVPSAPYVAQMIFYSGMSTAEQVSQVSGRGVGMEAVKTFVEEQGGTLALDLLEPDCSVDGFAPFKITVNLPNEFILAS